MNESDLAQALRREIAARVRCPMCERHLRVSDIQLLEQRGRAWVLRTHCPICHTRAVLFAVMDERAAQMLYTDLEPDEWTRVQARPPISTDDVIAFHQFIHTYAGDFSEILDEPLPPE